MYEAAVSGWVHDSESRATMKNALTPSLQWSIINHPDERMDSFGGRSLWSIQLL